MLTLLDVVAGRPALIVKVESLQVQGTHTNKARAWDESNISLPSSWKAATPV